MWAPLASQSPVLTFQRTGPSANTPGYSRWPVEGGQTQEQGAQRRTRKDREKQRDQRESGFYYDCVRTAQQITRLAMSRASYPARNGPKMLHSHSFWCVIEEEASMFLSSSYCSLSPKLIFEGRWVNQGALRTNGVESPQNEKLLSLSLVEGLCLSVINSNPVLCCFSRQQILSFTCL